MQGGHRIVLTGKTGIASATIAADGPTNLSTIEMRGLLCGIDHSRLRLLDALSTLLDWEESLGLGEGMSTEWKICHSRTVFYPGDAQQFLEAVLNISEKLPRHCSEKRSAASTAGAAWSSASDGIGPGGLRAVKF
jgi:hypothetical protein